MNTQAQSFVLKVLLFSHTYLFLTQKSKFSITIIILSVLLLIFSHKTALLETWFDLIMKKLGRALLACILSIIYVLIVIPSRLFYKNRNQKGTSLENGKESKIDFRRPW